MSRLKLATPGIRSGQRLTPAARRRMFSEAGRRLARMRWDKARRQKRGGGR